MGHSSDGHKGSRFIQHHFDDAQHQFDCGKLGMWLFLVQEILFFSGLFVAYIIYRSYHTEIFDYAHAYLDTQMGAINTGVLIFSSLTAAWAVRAAQLNQRKILIACLSITILCSFAFLGIKYVEYSHKIHVGTLFGNRFDPCETPKGVPLKCKKWTEEDGRLEAAIKNAAPGEERNRLEVALKDHRSVIPEGGWESIKHLEPPENTGMFFSIYFGMTGLHGIHVLLGAVVFIWLLIRAIRGHFTPDYYGPVDYAALYWHLVDLIWIYLFPLLYLIH